ncbi:MAG: type II toxin-antitoxin system RelE/ParE family toxin [Pseudobutyrivibrio sp.]|nr:type II toxin-antitoxin system RelE/ParE family toxin [Pseudobutyrivibrio sp.]
MKIEYLNEKVEEQCTSLKTAQKLFGGDAVLARSLHSRINLLVAAETIKDIILMPQLHFHALHNKDGRDLEGYFAIDVKSRREQWRIILQPLDKEGEYYNPCNIDEIAGSVRVVEIAEVSKHYE